VKILIAYYSRTGHTDKLAEILAEELNSRGHTIAIDRIEVVKRRSKWILLAQQIYTYPVIAVALYNSSFRAWWYQHYPQVEEDIQAPAYPDVSEFDLVCIGGPKWAEICYPVARYLRQVKGLQNKKVAAFATFGGPPLKIFELEMVFRPISDRVENSGGRVVATLGLSSNYHELYVLPLMKLASRINFGRPLKSFHISSEYGKEKIKEFCDTISG
jgi:hypothetical protein